jgi:hypothetical protein
VRSCSLTSDERYLKIYPLVTARVCGLVGSIVIVLGQVDVVLQHFPYNVDSRLMYIQNDRIACKLQSDF